MSTDTYLPPWFQSLNKKSLYQLELKRENGAFVDPIIINGNFTYHEPNLPECEFTLNGDNDENNKGKLGRKLELLYMQDYQMLKSMSIEDPTLVCTQISELKGDKKSTLKTIFPPPTDADVAGAGAVAGDGDGAGDGADGGVAADVADGGVAGAVAGVAADGVAAGAHDTTPQIVDLNSKPQLKGVRKKIEFDSFEYTITVPANYLPNIVTSDLNYVCYASNNTQSKLTINGISAINYFEEKDRASSIRISLCLIPKDDSQKDKLALELISFKSDSVIHEFPNDADTKLQFESQSDIAFKGLENSWGTCKIYGRFIGYRLTGYRFSSTYEYTIDMSQFDIDFSQKQIEQITTLMETYYKNIHVNGEPIMDYLGSVVKGTIKSCVIIQSKGELPDRRLTLQIVNDAKPYNLRLNDEKRIFKVYTNKKIEGIKLGKSYAEYLDTYFSYIRNKDKDNSPVSIFIPPKFNIFWILLFQKFDKDGEQKMRYDVYLKHDAKEIYKAAKAAKAAKYDLDNISKDHFKNIVNEFNKESFDADIFDMTWEILINHDQKVKMTDIIKNFLRLGGKSKIGTRRRRRVHANSFSRRGGKHGTRRRRRVHANSFSRRGGKHGKGRNLKS